MYLYNLINEISEEAKKTLKPDLIKFGKNYRAISESAILETLNPLFKSYGLCPEIHIKNSEIHIEKINVGFDSSGAMIQQLMFVARVEVEIVVRLGPDSVVFDGVGMGVDPGDKAMGKAYTGAVKYAYLKGFRLQYSDDPDSEASQEINSLDGSKKVAPEAKTKKEETHKKAEKEASSAPVTDAQLAYIKGLTIRLGLSDEEFEKTFKRKPYDTNITTSEARKIIDQLKKKEEESLPF